MQKEAPMLILSRKNNEAIVVGGAEGFDRTIKITVVEVKNGRVRLGFEADADVPVNRFEVWERISGEMRQPIQDPIADPA
jgi:carbon storage regulator CsrA